MPDPTPVTTAVRPARRPASVGGYFASKYFTPTFFPVAYFPATRPSIRRLRA